MGVTHVQESGNRKWACCNSCNCMHKHRPTEWHCTWHI